MLLDSVEKLGATALSFCSDISDESRVLVSFDEAIQELSAGQMIVVVDDDDRKNEGDLTMAAEMIIPEAITFLAMHARGLICLANTGERADELQLAPMKIELWAGLEW